MKKFIVIYRATQSFMEGIKNMTPEQNKKDMDSWMAWAKECGEHLVDFGTPLTNAHKISKDGHGPFKSDIVGYSILQAGSWDEVKKLIKGHPHLNWASGCEIEIHESVKM
jgi:hypothetical protein